MKTLGPKVRERGDTRRSDAELLLRLGRSDSSGLSRFRFIQLKDAPCSIEIDDVSVDDHLVFARIWRNAMHIFYDVPLSPKCLNEKVDVDHHVRLENARSNTGCP